MCWDLGPGSWSRVYDGVRGVMCINLVFLLVSNVEVEDSNALSSTQKQDAETMFTQRSCPTNTTCQIQQSCRSTCVMPGLRNLNHTSKYTCSPTSRVFMNKRDNFVHQKSTHHKGVLEITAMSTTTSQSKPTLPPPQTFDILPTLHELLARIDHAPNLTSLDLSPPDSGSTDLGSLYADLPPLEPKELPIEVLQIKAKIRRALKELEKLPDMERSVEEQEEEIRELEERGRRQMEVERRLGSWGGRGVGGMG